MTNYQCNLMAYTEALYAKGLGSNVGPKHGKRGRRLRRKLSRYFALCHMHPNQAVAMFPK